MDDKDRYSKWFSGLGQISINFILFSDCLERIYVGEFL